MSANAQPPAHNPLSLQSPAHGSIDFRNLNSLWASAAIESLVRLGLKTAVVCPGSRSTPLTFALARHPKVEALPILDERSAAFFALGCAKRQHRPVLLVCTSGTAGANFYPAVIEAHESGVPLLIFTADRPSELRDCASGQTVDQHRLYGPFVRHYSEVALPDVALLGYLRQSMVSAWRRAIAPQAGPVHLNWPFRDPLPPISDAASQEMLAPLAAHFEADSFFASVVSPLLAREQTSLPLDDWQRCEKGLIIAGPASPQRPKDYCQAVANIATTLGWPVLAEGLSPLRNYRSENALLISTYDSILRKAERADALMPQQVIQLGPLPTSKVLREWLQRHSPLRWVVDESGLQQNLDPLHGPVQFLSTAVEGLWQQMAVGASGDSFGRLRDRGTSFSVLPGQSMYRQQWLRAETKLRRAMDDRLANENLLVESKLVWLLSGHLPKGTPLFIANSMPVRDVEYFWQMSDRAYQPFFSRGANGIDGTLSTALGIAHHNKPTVLLTGDLAFLHDTNGLLAASQLAGHLTIVLINNGGGGIFELLPIAQFEPEFEKYFVTPQQAKFPSLCETYGVGYQLIETVEDFVGCIKALPSKGVRLLEVRCDDAVSPSQMRQQSVQQRKDLLNSL
jgi:2-succinyl-5-enolpyruvyl-6-hydroxy-3-cyclohexene-1-carboxylate synthase